MNDKAKEFWMNESKETLIEHLFECIHNGEVLLARIDKAIEYLEDNTRYSILSGMVEFYGSTDEVIDILKGSDSNE